MINHKENIVDYYSRISTTWDHWQNKNRFYHNEVRDLINRLLLPGQKTLEFGSYTGDLLDSLKPSRGIGLNFSDPLTVAAKNKHPHLSFFTTQIDQVPALPDFFPEAVVMKNMLDYSYDIANLMESLRPCLKDNSRVVITVSNPLWEPILSAATYFGFRVPDCPRNYITPADMENILALQGFDLIERGTAVAVVKNIPFFGSFLNAILAEMPLFKHLGSLHYYVARPKINREALSCSVVIPCHNEEGNVEECIRRVPNMGIRTEIVVVDDGSTDQTATLVRRVMEKDSRVRLIQLRPNAGKANAVRTGFNVATGDVLMILDADMTVEPEDLPRFFSPIQNGSADFVNGTRFVYPMEGAAMRAANNLGNRLFCYVTGKIMRQRVSDTLCGTKVMLKRDFVRMPVYQKERWGDFSLLFGAARLKLKILEVPIHYKERRAGVSKMRAFREAWLFLAACLDAWKLLRWKVKPGLWLDVNQTITRKPIEFSSRPATTISTDSPLYDLS